MCSFFFFFNDTATTEIYTLSLHDALPIYVVDLVWIVGAPGGHDAHVTLGFLGLDLGVRIGHREDDGIPGHALDVTNRKDARHAQPDEDFGLLHGVADPALDLPGLRGRRHPALHRI